MRLINCVLVFAGLILFAACASKPIEISGSDKPAEIIQDLDLICNDLAKTASNRVGNGDQANNRVGNGDQANNRVGNGAPQAMSSLTSGNNLLPGLLKTTTGREIYSLNPSQRATSAKLIAEKLGKENFSCP